jgi:hypothetical protein
LLVCREVLRPALRLVVVMSAACGGAMLRAGRGRIDRRVCGSVQTIRSYFYRRGGNDSSSRKKFFAIQGFTADFLSGKISVHRCAPCYRADA